MENETINTPEVSAPEKSKKSIYITLIVLILISLLAWGLSTLNKPAPVVKNPCAIDIIQATVYEHASSSASLTEIEAARIVFNQLFSTYKTIPDCGASAISDFKLISVGTPTKLNEKDKYTVPVVFDLKPLSMTETKWITASSTDGKIDGDWIRGKKGVLSIWHHENIYQLMLF